MGSSNGSAILVEEDQDETIVLHIPLVGLVSIASAQVQHRSAVEGWFPLPSGTMGCPPAVVDDEETGRQGSDGEEEDENENENEADLLRAMNLRRSARWLVPPTMLMPVNLPR